VVTDGESHSGIGDQGGRRARHLQWQPLAHTVMWGGGIRPERTLPIVLDVAQQQKTSPIAGTSVGVRNAYGPSHPTIVDQFVHGQAAGTTAVNRNVPAMGGLATPHATHPQSLSHELLTFNDYSSGPHRRLWPELALSRWLERV